MSASPADVRQTVVDFLSRADRLPAGFTSGTPLYGGGVGLDSLDVAELSATLEAAHGRDPYTSGQMPLTLDDIVGFYAAAHPARPS
ncbi:MAG: hypothetical protein ABW075_05490 [Aeromicrobium sp.]